MTGRARKNARVKALRRSRRNQPKPLAERAERLVDKDAERDLRDALTVARREMQETLATANVEFRQDLDAAQEKLAEARRGAWERYDERRDTILKAHAKKQRAAA